MKQGVKYRIPEESWRQLWTEDWDLFGWRAAAEMFNENALRPDSRETFIAHRTRKS